MTGAHIAIALRVLASSIVYLGRADEACPATGCTDKPSLSPSLLQFKRVTLQEKVSDAAEEETRFPACAPLITSIITSKESNLCMPSNGGRVKYTGRPCGNDGVQIEWMSSKALDFRGNLKPWQCEWDWLAHGARDYYAGGCGVLPKIDGGNHLPTKCVRGGEGGGARVTYAKSYTYCSNIQCNTIGSVYECNLATEKMGFPKVSKVFAKDTRGRQPGCLVNPKSRMVEFNSNLEVTGTRRDVTSICSCEASPRVRCRCLREGKYECTDGSVTSCPSGSKCRFSGEFEIGSSQHSNACKAPMKLVTTATTTRTTFDWDAINSKHKNLQDAYWAAQEKEEQEEQQQQQQQQQPQPQPKPQPQLMPQPQPQPQTLPPQTQTPLPQRELEEREKQEEQPQQPSSPPISEDEQQLEQLIAEKSNYRREKTDLLLRASHIYPSPHTCTYQQGRYSVMCLACDHGPRCGYNRKCDHVQSCADNQEVVDLCSADADCYYVRDEGKYNDIMDCLNKIAEKGLDDDTCDWVFDSSKRVTMWHMTEAILVLCMKVSSLDECSERFPYYKRVLSDMSEPQTTQSPQRRRSGGWPMR